MKTTLHLLWLSSVLSLADQVSLRVDPDQSQFFKYDSVSLSCEDSSGDWTVKRNSSDCTRGCCRVDKWGRLEDSLCKITRLFPSDSGRYWCESRDGQTSDSVYITVKETGVVMQVPVLPVAEGQTVSLSCKDKHSSKLPARFNKDGHILWEQPTGHMTLQQVSAYDEGLYQCEIRGETSDSNWIRVRPGKPSTTEAPPPASERPLALALLRCLVVLCPYVVSTVLMMSLYRGTLSENGQAPSTHAPPTQAPPTQAEPELYEDYHDIMAVITEHQF